ncbi:MAG: 50S ribosomal protein L11 methyltransferase [Bacteroidia bacterium]|nr:50S ribosomal protein L11 methyltransferase [Bacteroidia bacterium]
MNNYLLLEITCEELMRDILIAELAEAGFEGFIEKDNGFDAYLPEEEFNREATYEIFERYEIPLVMVTKKIMPQQNWNAQWESSFEPVVINERLIIKAPFHKIEKAYPYELIIQPKTSFGTGHHETTHIIMELMLNMDFNNKHVFDYGSGTGILAILATKLGAKSVFANDIDDWAADNILENAGLNNVNNIQFKKGDLSTVPHQMFDVILANLNKNILMKSFDGLSKLLKPHCPLLISGFYESDLHELSRGAAGYGVELSGQKVMNNWCAAVLIKQ